jgi:hypothetical protein
VINPAAGWSGQFLHPDRREHYSNGGIFIQFIKPTPSPIFLWQN